MKASPSLAIATAPQPPISSLPPELRESIYSNLLREEHDEPCSKVLLGLENVGCLCGPGLSLTNRFFYNELRGRMYKCMTFIFNKPVFADRFFRRLGNRSNFVTSLKLTYKNTLVNSFLLRDVFAWLSKSNLRHLELRVLPDNGLPDPASLPIYMISAPGAVEFEIGRYDHLLRPLRTSLQYIQSLQSLTVIGHPNRDGEEAII
jgi:hypothetical protein